jgi:hypothetical protein
MRSVQAGESLYDRVEWLRQKLVGVAHVAVPFEPDCDVLAV